MLSRFEASVRVQVPVDVQSGIHEVLDKEILLSIRITIDGEVHRISSVFHGTNRIEVRVGWIENLAILEDLYQPHGNRNRRVGLLLFDHLGYHRIGSSGSPQCNPASIRSEVLCEAALAEQDENQP